MNKPNSADFRMRNSIDSRAIRRDDISIKLVFSKEPDQKAPGLIRELLKKSYFDHLVSESRDEL